MSPRSSCVACKAEAMSEGRYAGVLCLACALVASGARKPRREVAAEHRAIHEAFRANNRVLADLGPTTAPASTVAAAPPDADTLAAVVALMAIGARPVRTLRRCGDLPPVVRPIEQGDDPLNPCALCGTASTGIKRAPYGTGDHVWVLCMSPDTCMARARKAKGEAA